MNIKKNLEIKNLSFSFTKYDYVFKDINIKVNESTLLGLVGSNGSGKTTFLNCVSDYYKNYQGSVLINNEKIDNWKKEISYITSNFNLIHYLTIYENIQFFLAFYNTTLDKELIKYYLTKYELSNHQNKLLDSCSKGMKKKLQIIIAMLTKPQLLLCDEPFDGLDNNSANKFTDELLKFTEDGNIAIVISHDNNWINTYATKIISMDDLKNKNQNSNTHLNMSTSR